MGAARRWQARFRRREPRQDSVADVGRHDLTATPCTYGRVRLIPQCLAEPELADLRAQLDGMLRGQASVPNRRLREIGSRTRDTR